MLNLFVETSKYAYSVSCIQNTYSRDPNFKGVGGWGGGG